jgi:nitroreductase/NAD-dependent dihydropyrimidine dehydrogenase PreA subunit
MSLLHVDKDKCTRCGACADVCPAALIEVREEGPVEAGFRQCIACGHCVAVCPVAALDNTSAPLSGQISLDDYHLPTSEDAARFLRYRRSIRSYKKEPVSQEKLRQVLDVARFASTGGNMQGLSYIVLSDKKTLTQISAATVKWMEEEIAKGTEGAIYFEGIVRNTKETGKDIILRDAPHLIVAMCNRDFVRGAQNAFFSLAYAELFAPSVGVGTCWAGLVMGCVFSGYAPVIALLDLPAGKAFTGALMAGYPRYTYHRLVDRKPLEVIWR